MTTTYLDQEDYSLPEESNDWIRLVEYVTKVCPNKTFFEVNQLFMGCPCDLHNWLRSPDQLLRFAKVQQDRQKYVSGEMMNTYP